MSTSFLNKIGRKAFTFGKHALSKLGNFGDLLIQSSRTFGKVENHFDKLLDLAQNVPIARDAAHLLRENSIYKGVRGNIDEARAFIESPGFQRGVDILHNLGDGAPEQHRVFDIFPVIPGPISVGIDIANRIAQPVGA